MLKFICTHTIYLHTIIKIMKQVKHEGVKGIMLIECHTRNSLRGPIFFNSHSRTNITYKYANYDVTMSIFKARISFELFFPLFVARWSKKDF